jgi:hypothetical protein
LLQKMNSKVNKAEKGVLESLGNCVIRQLTRLLFPEEFLKSL